MRSPVEMLLEQQRRQTNRVVLRSAEMQLRVGDLLRSIERMATEYERADLRSVAILADNSPAWIIADLAAELAGVTVVPIPPFFSAEQVDHVVVDSGVDAILVDELCASVSLALPTRFQAELANGLLLLRVNNGDRCPPIPACTAKVSYTSGTTGRPKGVCLSAKTLKRVANGVCTAIEDLEIQRHLCLLPLATLLENVAGVYAPLLAEAEVVVPSLDEVGLTGSSGLNIERLASCLERYQPESLILLPEMLQAIVHAVDRGMLKPGYLKFAAVGGAVVSQELLDRAEEVGIPAYEGYGLTECGSVVALNTPAARRAGSVGRPLPHCGIRIGPDAEILVSGVRMSGYLGADDVAVASEISTGDIGHIDQDGYLYVDGRKKNVLITSFGRNLSPEWVESKLTSTASIAQAALFGDGKPFNVAVVVPRRGSSFQAVADDIGSVNSRLPDYARVGRWILAGEPFHPHNGLVTENGRVRREQVLQQYLSEIESCYAYGLASGV